jgi:hypothetical protein
MLEVAFTDVSKIYDDGVTAVDTVAHVEYRN